MSYAALGGMILLVAIITAVAGAFALVLNHLRKAPVGYEDGDGFHIIRQIKGSAVVRHRRLQDVTAGSLKGARAHS